MDKQSPVKPSPCWVILHPSAQTQILPFYLSEGGYFITTRDYSISQTGNSGYMLMYTVAGQGIIKQNNHTISLIPNHCTIVDCSLPHTYYNDGDHWEFIWLYLFGNGTNTMYDLVCPQGIEDIVIHDNDLFKNKLEELLHKCKSTLEDIKSNVICSALIHDILNDALIALLDFRTHVSIRNFENEMKFVVAYIKDNFSQQLTLNDLVNVCHLSKAHFIRIFKNCTGVTPYHYLMTYRINTAKAMLNYTDETVSEISQNCGFLDTSQFIRHFKKYTDISPLQYRKLSRPGIPEDKTVALTLSVDER